jgi:hypothetical protein
MNAAPVVVRFELQACYEFAPLLFLGSDDW